jgi:hypothetical protein
VRPGCLMTCAGPGEITGPSTGADPARTPGRWSPSWLGVAIRSVSRGGASSGVAAASKPAT